MVITRRGGSAQNAWVTFGEYGWVSFGERRRLRRYANPDLLIIDEFGFDRIERAECPEAAHLLYKIIASRNQKRSTALVTNVDFDKWGEYLVDGPLAMALLDRLVERAIILKVKGKTYRTPLAKSEENPT